MGDLREEVSWDLIRHSQFFSDGRSLSYSTATGACTHTTKNLRNRINLNPK